MKLLDLFCGAGGCSVGYARAGFEVIGVDKDPHPEYPFELIVDDAMNWVTNPDRLLKFDAVHASPPCPRFSTATPHDRRQGHPDLLTPTLESFHQWGGTWVIENVPGAPLPGAVTYCGKAMGLPYLKRHRLFASSVFLMAPGCACDNQPTFGVYGDHGDLTPVRRPNGTSRGNKARDVTHAQQVMGIDWMTQWDDLADAIPPNFTQHIGGQLLDILGRSAA